MTDFAKTLLAIVVTTVLTNGVSVATLSADIANVVKSVDKVEVKLDKFDNRIRANEIDIVRNHGSTIARNTND